MCWARQYLTCDSNQHVTLLNLHNQELLGTIPGNLFPSYLRITSYLNRARSKHTHAHATTSRRIFANDASIYIDIIFAPIEILVHGLFSMITITESIGGLSYMANLYMDQNEVRKDHEALRARCVPDYPP